MGLKGGIIAKRRKLVEQQKSFHDNEDCKLVGELFETQRHLFGKVGFRVESYHPQPNLL